jgi:hypothetical protein
MSRGAQTIKQNDVTSAAKGAVKAGLVVTRVEVDTKAGKIIVFTGPPPDDAGDSEDLRKLL